VCADADCVTRRRENRQDQAPEPFEPPFPYFGGKRKIAGEVWRRLGNPDTYVEPFAGSLAVLVGRPKEHAWWRRRETINDYSGHVVNFYRAVKADPQAVMRHANWPVTEADLTARHLELVSREQDLAQGLIRNPKYFDAELAGWWVWGISAWVGGEWCSGLGPLKRHPDSPGVYRKMPMSAASHGGKGIHRAVADDPQDWVSEMVPDLEAHMEQRMEQVFVVLSQRLRRVRILCGDWSRLTKSVVKPARGEVTGIFLDPPYDLSQRRANLYGPNDGQAKGSSASSRSAGSVKLPTQVDPNESARVWALTAGDDPQLRIAYCTYEDATQSEEFTAAGWSPYTWTASGGYGLQSQRRARENRQREIVWFSPACLSDIEAERARNPILALEYAPSLSGEDE
jgi:DNA adenine methylase